MAPSTEAVREWLRSLERDMVAGDFHRHAEMREALVAAAEEVERSTRGHLRDALYVDAIGAVSSPSRIPWRWVVAGAIGGVVGGVVAGLVIGAMLRKR